MTRLAFALTLGVSLVALAPTADAQRGDRHDRGREDRGSRDRGDRRGDDHGRGQRGLAVQSMVPDAGPVGSTVTLRGTFPDDARVTFGGRDVPATRGGGGSLRFAVPNAPPGVHAVAVRSGREQVSAGQFRVGPMQPPSPAVVPPLVAVRPPPPRARLARVRAQPVVTGFTPRRGPAGTAVTIQGEHFGRGTTAVFGGSPVASTVTPSAITFTVPPGASTGAIALRRPGTPDLVVGTFRVRADRRGEAQRRALEEQLRREAEAAWRARQAQRAADRTARIEALRQQEAALAQSRAERRAAQLVALRERWEQAFLRRPEVIAELALHAQRTAQLERMLRIAEAQKDDLVVRIELLIRREAARHQQRMSDLRAAFA